MVAEEALIGNAGEMPGQPRYCMKDESLNKKSLGKTGKTREEDDFESGDLPCSVSQFFRGKVSVN